MAAEATQHIFHEKQETGSMLCAQHALNNLLQNPLFSAAELANIGHELDAIEASHLDADEALAERMQNVDDSGFFSVAVIEKGLQAMDLKLIRWDSQEMLPYQTHPEHQVAFILNLGQHWFTMRRFASNQQFWFNLNSFLPQPERISEMYLGLQVHEAQREGYSVFAIRPIDEDAMISSDFLPPCEADDFFASNSHLAYASYGNTPTSSGLKAGGSSSSTGSRRARSASFDFPEDDQPPALQKRRISPSDETEEEMIRRAIEASMADVQASSSKSSIPAEANVSRSSQKKKSRQNAETPLSTTASNSSWDLVSSDNNKTSNSVIELNSEDELEDAGASLARALNASLGHEHGQPEKADSGFGEDDFVPDEPTAEELRAKRLARFQS